MKKITLPQLKKIIAEELKVTLEESVDHESIRTVVNGAGKLLAAVEAFKKVATPSMINALTPGLDKVEKVLEKMVNMPGSYVEKQKPSVKKVSLKPSKSSDNLV